MMRSSRPALAAVTIAAALLTSCTRTPETDPRFVLEWAHTMYGVIRQERLSPPVASRLMAYSASALYSAMAAANPRVTPLSRELNGLPELPRANAGDYIDETVAAVAAETELLDSLLVEALPTTRSALKRLSDSLIAARGTAGVSHAALASSVTFGTRIGRAFVAWSRTDGFDSTRGKPFTPPVGLAYWVNDAPANTYAEQNLSGASKFVALDNPANAMRAGKVSDRGLILSRPKRNTKTLPAVNMAGMSEPYWGRIRPFVLTSWNECPVPQPPSYATDTSADLYRHARVVEQMIGKNTPRLTLSGEIDTASTRSQDEKKAIAFFWADNTGESGTPVGHWVSIAAQVASERHLSAEDAARLLALTSLAQADAFIASWGYKYQYTLIRPRTYIRRVIDSTWEPLIPTPPFPEYPSGHSTVSSAAAEVLTGVLGDNVAFEDSTSLAIGNPVRGFPSFRAAAHEAGISRIYGGIHFQYGNLGGRALGECIGQKVIERMHARATQ